MKYLKTYESFNFDDNKYQAYVKKYGKEFADAILKSSQKKSKISLNIDSSNDDIIEFIKREGINIVTSSDTEEEVIEKALDIMNYIRNNNILYRVIAVENKEDIDTDNLGKHYTISKDRIDDMFLDQIGIDLDSPMYLVSVEVDKSNIDVEKTIKKVTEWSHEDEVLLKDDSNVKIINIEKL